jgi:hypothetical protein
MPSQPNHEPAFIESFVVARRREQWLLLAKPKRREKIINHLNHCECVDFDPRTVVPIQGPWSRSDAIPGLIGRVTSTDTCAMISGGSLDGQTVPLTEALDHVVGSSNGTILSIDPGKVAMYEPENGRGRCLLIKDPAARDALLSFMGSQDR